MEQYHQGWGERERERENESVPIHSWPCQTALSVGRHKHLSKVLESQPVTFFQLALRTASNRSLRETQKPKQVVLTWVIYYKNT